MGLTYTDGIEVGVKAAVKVLREQQKGEELAMDRLGADGRYAEAAAAETRVTTLALAAHEVRQRLGRDPQEAENLAGPEWA